MKKMEASSTLRLCKAQIPDYLQSSAFLENWVDSDELVEINSAVLKLDSLVSCLADLHHLLQTLRYWIVHDMPPDVFEFVLNGREELSADVLQELSKDLPGAASLLRIIQVPKSERWLAALRSGDLNCVQYMYKNCLADLTVDCCTVAVETGRINCLKYLRGEGLEWSENVCRAAVQYGHIQCVQYLLHNDCPRPADLCDVAAQYGQLDCLKHLHQQGYSWSHETCRLSAQKGHLECLMYLHENGCDWDADTCAMSAAGGHLACLRYAINNNCTLTKRAVYLASENGHVHILHDLLSQGDSPWIRNAADKAAQYGQLACLQYLHSIGCDLSFGPPMYAACYGHLTCLQYLHERGYAWNASTTIMAASGSHMDCLVYAVEHGCPCVQDGYDVAGSVETKNYIAMILNMQNKVGKQFDT